MDHLFVGQIVHCKSIDDFEIITDGFMAVLDGEIIKIGRHDELPHWLAANHSFSAPTTQLGPAQFLMPGFVDCHIHAPQMPNIGLGLDMELLDWLNEYTFPLEAQFEDPAIARHVYEKVIRRTLANGTTLASYFATNHREGSVILAREAIKQGQRAFVGKVSSNCCSPSYYVEETDQSVDDNREFVKEVLAFKNDLVQPIVTPRFAVSCDMTLMKHLAELAHENDLHIQSHISENLGEIEHVKKAFNLSSYTKVYDTAGLLTKKTVMAHGVHLSDDELHVLHERGTSIAHCPTSNTGIHSGLCDVRRILGFGVKVGLGTDVSGGCKSSILSTIKDAIDVSESVAFVRHQIVSGMEKSPKTLDASYRPLNYKEAIYLATLGGAEALSVQNVVGNFVEGKEFDALLVDASVDGAFDTFSIPKLDALKSPEKRLLELVQRFVHTGDDRNIVKVFVQGRQVKGGHENHSN